MTAKPNKNKEGVDCYSKPFRLLDSKQEGGINMKHSTIKNCFILFVTIAGIMLIDEILKQVSLVSIVLIIGAIAYMNDN